MSQTLSDSQNMQGSRHLSDYHRQRISEGWREKFLEREKKEPHVVTEKACSICGIVKPADQFYKGRARLKSGIVKEYLKGECKQCGTDRIQASRTGLPIEEIRERRRDREEGIQYRSIQSAQAAGEERMDPGPLRQYLIEHGVTGVPGVHSSVIYNIKRGRVKTVGLDLVDRILGGREDQVLLHELYPLD